MSFISLHKTMQSFYPCLFSSCSAYQPQHVIHISTQDNAIFLSLSILFMFCLPTPECHSYLYTRQCNLFILVYSLHVLPTNPSMSFISLHKTMQFFYPCLFSPCSAYQPQHVIHISTQDNAIFLSLSFLFMFCLPTPACHSYLYTRQCNLFILVYSLHVLPTNPSMSFISLHKTMQSFYPCLFSSCSAYQPQHVIYISTQNNAIFLSMSVLYMFCLPTPECHSYLYTRQCNLFILVYSLHVLPQSNKDNHAKLL